MTVRLVQRGEHALLPPFDEMDLRAGDTVVVAATRRALTEALTTMPDLVPAAGLSGDGDQILTEVMVAPASRLSGRNLQQIGFHYQTGCIVMGVQRRARMIRANMEHIRLEPGDVLLVLGTERNITALRENRDVLPLEWSAHELPARSKAKRAGFIFAAVVVTAVAGLLPIAIAAIVGAVAMVATGCLNVHQAVRAVDRRVVFLIAAALAMGVALKGTGGATYLAEAIVAQSAGFGPAVTLSALFLLIVVATNVVSNNAAAVLFTPVAISAAQQLGVAPAPFVYAVILAANCSFATPIGYQTNLLVMGPGHYRFSDFLRAGGPLTLILWLSFSIFAPWYYDL